MASRTPVVWKRKRGIEKNAEFGEVEVSTGDTITFEYFDSVNNLLEAYLIKQSDGTAVTVTHAAGNVVSVTGAGLTNVDCVYIVYSYKA